MKWRPILKKLLYPGLLWVILLAVLGGVMLFITFSKSMENTPFAYIAYVLSAYALVVVVAEAVTGGKALRRKLYDMPMTNRYLTDAFFRVRVGLHVSLLVSVAYAVLRLINAVRFSSFWDGALALYYLLLCGVRVYLILGLAKDRNVVSYRHELYTYRTTGFFLVTLSLALDIIAVQIVRAGQGYRYQGYLIFAMGFYAFYCLILSSINTVKYRKFKSPVLSAAKAVNLTTALVSMFSLETAMLDQFGDDPEFQTWMTAGTAIAVCTMVLAIAVFMVIGSGKNLRAAKEDNQ